jgi:rRNA maturation RNase YbeY
MPSKSKVYFFFDNKKLGLQNRGNLKRFIEYIFKKEKKQLSSLNYIFCSDKKLLEINQSFLNHDFFTDIITFDLSEDENICAEIYISVDRVKENSKTLKASFTSELHRVLFHGVLHLCGYKDKTKAEKQKMREKEEYYINQYFK